MLKTSTSEGKFEYSVCSVTTQLGKEKPTCRGRERKSVRCFCSVFLFSALPSLSSIVERVSDLGCHRPRTYLDTGAAIIGWEIERCLFCVNVSATTLGPECKHTHTHWHSQIHSQPHSLNHHPPLFKTNGWYLAFHYSHLCFSLTAVWRLISMLLCFVWYGAAPMHFYSLSYIAFLFKAMWLFVCVFEFVKKRVCILQI